MLFHLDTLTKVANPHIHCHTHTHKIKFHGVTSLGRSEQTVHLIMFLQTLISSCSFCIAVSPVSELSSPILLFNSLSSSSSLILEVLFDMGDSNNIFRKTTPYFTKGNFFPRPSTKLQKTWHLLHRLSRAHQKLEKLKKIKKKSKAEMTTYFFYGKTLREKGYQKISIWAMGLSIQCIHGSLILKVSDQLDIKLIFNGRRFLFYWRKNEMTKVYNSLIR